METLSFHTTAGQFLKKYYEENLLNSLQFTYRFLASLANEAEHIATSMELRGMDYENAVVATWFRFAGVVELGSGYTNRMKDILEAFFDESGYPPDQREIVENTIIRVVTNDYADTEIEKVVSDAINSQYADYNFPQNLMYIRDEFNRQNGVERPELTYLEYFKSLFIQIRYYTPYATEKYSKMKNKNFEFLEHRIEKLSEGKKDKKEKSKSNSDELVILSNKETEDLFKIAFRNYNHLISVADSKASLLINVNSIIISVMIAFVLGKIDKLFFILWPTIILLTVCLGTILLAILASRPQSNHFLENRSSLSYQRFFFGSFDLVDPEFNRVEWEEYYKNLVELFGNQKDRVYMEIYKESFNVRKVLARKFDYLSKAYWVFLFGLLISVFAFVIFIYYNR
jgi:ABC-type multidrug transport system fused ATPase/permease subunit